VAWGGARATRRPQGARRVTLSVTLSFWRKLRARSRSNLYFALLFLDRDRREAFRDVYRFARAADDVADGSATPDEALAQLAQWRRELRAIYEGRATHPDALRLARVVDRYDLPREHFEVMLAALEHDARGPRVIETRAELLAYCEAVAASLAALCLRILGASGPAAERYARDVGVALQLVNILRDVREDARAGRVYLPRRELEAAGASPDALLRGQMSPGVADVCRDLAARARRLIAGARAELDRDLRRDLAVPEIWADVYLAQLRELERNEFDASGRRSRLRRHHKLALALRRYATVRVSTSLGHALR
jgi:15-cis-phytoene synthase